MIGYRFTISCCVDCLVCGDLPGRFGPPEYREPEGFTTRGPFIFP